MSGQPPTADTKSNTPFCPKDDPPASPDDPKEPCEKHYVRVSVPFMGTCQTMGSGIRKGTTRDDDQCDVLHFDGYGVTTRANIHLEARGEKANSRMKLQAAGDLTIHSNGAGVNIGGHEAVMLGTDGTSSIVANSGVVIAGGGFGLNTISCGLQDPGRDLEPATPSWVGSVKNVTAAVGAYLAAIDAGIGLNRSRVGVQREKHGLTDISLQPAERAQKIGGVIGAALSGLGSLYGVAAATGAVAPVGWLSQALAGTTIMGQSGLILGTPATIGMHSVLGTSIYSRVSVSINSDNMAAIAAKNAFSFVSECHGEISVRNNLFVAGGELLQIGSEKETEINSPRCRVLATNDISLISERGLIETRSSGFDVDAEDVSVAGTSYVLIDGGDLAVVRSANGDAALRAGGGVASVSGKSAVKITSGDGLVEVTEGKISISVNTLPDEFAMDKWEKFGTDYSIAEKNRSKAKAEKNEKERKRWSEEKNRIKRAREAYARERAKFVAGLGPARDKPAGIQITGADITLDVSGDKLSLAKGKCSVLKSLLIK
jgi:hypothetical protein